MPSPYQLEPIDESDLGLGKSGTYPEKKPETQGAFSPEQKESASEMSGAEKDATYNKILSQVQSQPQVDLDAEEIKNDASLAYQQMDVESQIQHLVDLAMSKGVIHVVKVAQHLEDNYVLDMLHDKLLADELHDALLKKGLIKEM